MQPEASCHLARKMWEQPHQSVCGEGAPAVRRAPARLAGVSPIGPANSNSS